MDSFEATFLTHTARRSAMRLEEELVRSRSPDDRIIQPNTGTRGVAR